MKTLRTPKEVMEAFLQNRRLQNSEYHGEDIWLYLSESGFICEEDGAGAKAHRVPIVMRNNEHWWELE